MIFRRSRIVGALSASVLAGCETYTDVPGPTPFRAEMTGAAVRPTAVLTAAAGEIAASYNPDGRLTYTAGWEGLSGDPTSVHLHGPADGAATADVLVDFNVLPDGSSGTTEMNENGSATGSLDLTRAVTATVSGDSLLVLLRRGRVYIDVHTSANPLGEIRGQIREP